MDIDRRTRPRYAPLRMSIPAPRLTREPDHDADERVIMFNVSWSGFEAQLALRGEVRVPRVAYLDGALELMSPSMNHERFAENIGRLIEVYAEEHGIEFQPYGRWTLRAAAKTAGLEPDSCYVLGDVQHAPTRPDLAIEVVWTHGGIDKLEIYRRIGVAEVWYWREGVISVFALREGSYEEVAGSQLLPGIDLPQLASFLDCVPISRAKREYRAALSR
jgi:Uma2 family endonuclease